MDDLIKRLRGRVGPLMYQHDNGIDITLEAADEIERLESLLGQVWDIGRDNELMWDARVRAIMAAIREKPDYDEPTP